MSWGVLVSVANALAILMWAALILLPRWPALLAAILYLGVGVLCFAYSSALIGMLSGVLDPVGGKASFDFGSIAAIRALFASDGVIAVGWIHYLAFDLFIGLWIARDADAKGFSRLVQVPVLLATFLAGPVGLFVWLLARERRARSSGRWH